MNAVYGAGHRKLWHHSGALLFLLTGAGAQADFRVESKGFQSIFLSAHLTLRDLFDFQVLCFSNFFQVLFRFFQIVFRLEEFFK